MGNCCLSVSVCLFVCLFVFAGVSGEGIEIDSVGGQSRSRFLRGTQKHVSEHV